MRNQPTPSGIDDPTITIATEYTASTLRVGLRQRLGRWIGAPRTGRVKRFLLTRLIHFRARLIRFSAPLRVCLGANKPKCRGTSSAWRRAQSNAQDSVPTLTSMGGNSQSFN